MKKKENGEKKANQTNKALCLPEPNENVCNSNCYIYIIIMFTCIHNM